MCEAAPLQYSEETVARPEMLWGKGFMSVGGPEEVSAILDGVNLKNLNVLDIGCGIGGVDFLLVSEHGAASVLGLDVEPHLLELGRERAATAGLSDQVTFLLCASPPYPLGDRSFDVVFSKGAILHITDKVLLFYDAARILKPGGLFIASDWLRGDASIGDIKIENFGASGIILEATPPHEMEKAMRDAGFTSIVMTDQTDRYLDGARRDLEKMKGPLRDLAQKMLGAEGYEDWIALQVGTVERLAARSVQPTHIHATRG